MMRELRFLWAVAILTLLLLLPVSAQNTNTYYIEPLDCSITLPNDWIGGTKENGEFRYMLILGTEFYAEDNDMRFSLDISTYAETWGRDFSKLTEKEQPMVMKSIHDVITYFGAEISFTDWFHCDQASYVKTKYTGSILGTEYLEYTTEVGGLEYCLMFTPLESKTFSVEAEVIFDKIVSSMEYSVQGSTAAEKSAAEDSSPAESTPATKNSDWVLPVIALLLVLVVILVICLAKSRKKKPEEKPANLPTMAAPDTETGGISLMSLSCPQCGRKILSSNNYCNHCGAKLAE